MDSNFFKEQVIPLSLTVLTFFCLTAILYFFILFLNLFPSQEKIIPQLRLTDVLVGLTIYLKTSIDFAIFMGNLMKNNPGWKKRIGIELGTATGNASGTLLILLIWNFFREVPILMVIMIIIASLVLLKMAEESIGEFLETQKSGKPVHTITSFLHGQLGTFNKIFKPILGKLLPNSSITNIKMLPFWSLALFSFSIPFILGLDDFAGYIPLFSVVNVFGFSVGVFLGHMILNLGLFISPSKTVRLVSTPVVLIIGGAAFIGIALWGFYEAFNILEHIAISLLTR